MSLSALLEDRAPSCMLLSKGALVGGEGVASPHRVPLDDPACSMLQLWSKAHLWAPSWVPVLFSLGFDSFGGDWIQPVYLVGQSAGANRLRRRAVDHP